MENNKNIFEHLKPRSIDTPDTSYFESLSADIISNNPAKAKVIPFYKKPVTWISAAACIALILTLFNINTNVEQDNFQLSFAELSSEEALDYIDNNIEEFDTELISSVLSEENLTIQSANNDSNTERNDKSSIDSPTLDFNQIETGDIMNYLIEEGIDPNDDSEDIFI